MSFPRIFRNTVLAVLFFANAAVAEFVTTANPVHPSGTRAQVDLPGDQHMQNVGGSDGAGLCVPTSQEVIGRWQSLPELAGFQAWCRKRPGGSTPNQLPADLKLFAQQKGVKLPSYIQHTGGDIELLRRAVKTRRMVGITYAGCDPFYGTNTGIAHMVDLVHLDGKLGAVVDNNQPGRYRWMDDVQLCNRWRGKRDNGSDVIVYDRFGRGFPVGGGWLVCWLGAPPPPVDTTSRDFLPDVSVQTDATETGEAEPVVFEPTPDDLLNGVREPIDTRMRYWVNDVEVDRVKAFKVMDDALVPDDSGKPYVSVVSADVEKVKAALAPYADRLHINVYGPGTWTVKDRLKFKLVAQLPASLGGKTVYSTDEVTTENLVLAAKKALGIAEPPPVMPKPDAPPVAPPIAPPVTPAPDAPSAPADPVLPPVHVPLWLIAGIGFLFYRLWSTK